MKRPFLSVSLLAVLVTVSANSADGLLSNSAPAPTQSTTAATSTVAVQPSATGSAAAPAPVPATRAPQATDTAQPTGTTSRSTDHQTATATRQSNNTSVNGTHRSSIVSQPQPKGDTGANDWEELAVRKVRFTPDAAGHHGVQVLWTVDSTKAAIEKTFGKDTLEGTPTVGQWANLKSSNLAPWVRDEVQALDARSVELAKARADLTSMTDRWQAAEKKLAERSAGLRDLLVYSALAVAAIAIGVAAWVVFTTRKKREEYDRLRAPLGKQDVTLKEMSDIIVTAVTAAPSRFTDIRRAVANETGFVAAPLKLVASSKLSLETWARWLAVLRDQELKELWVARTVLECNNDDRPVDRFVKDTVPLNAKLHRLLFKDRKDDSETEWGTVVKDLTEIVDQDLFARVAARSHGVLHDVEQARLTGEALQSAIAAVKPLLKACGVVDGPDLARDAARAAADVHSVLSKARQIAGNDVTDLGCLSDALDERLRQMEEHAANCDDQLTSARGQVAEAKAALESAQTLQQGVVATAGRYRTRAEELARRLELEPSSKGALEDDELYTAEFLSGPEWTFRLVLLAARDCWRSSAQGISPGLVSLLGIESIPEQFSRSLRLLNDLQSRTKTGGPQGPQSADFGGLEVLWRAVDALTRIVEFGRVYQLTELDPLEPIALVATTMARTFLADRGVELRRPRLLEAPGSDFGKFRSNYRNEELRPFPGIQKRILEELKKGLDEFVVDVTQSEVRMEGSIQRVGVFSLVSPQHWPPGPTGH